MDHGRGGGQDKQWQWVPLWDGRPESFQHFIHEVKWTLSSSRADERALLAAKIIRKALQSGHATLVQLMYKLDPSEFRTEADVHKLISFLEKSPLNRQALPDAGAKIGSYYRRLQKRGNESVQAFLIREDRTHDEMLKALQRLLREKELSFDGYDMTLDELKSFCGFQPGESVYYPSAEDEEVEDERSSRGHTPKGSGKDGTAKGSAKDSKTPSEVSGKGGVPSDSRRGKDLIDRLMSKGLLPLAALDVIRGWLLLEMALSNEDDRRIVRAATQGKLGYFDIRAALLSMFEERQQKGYGHHSKGGKANFAAEWQEEDPSWCWEDAEFEASEYDGYTMAHDPYSYGAHDYDYGWGGDFWPASSWPEADVQGAEHSSQQSAEPMIAEAPDEVYQCATEEMQEAERSHAELQALMAESERSLDQARKAVAAAAKDRGWNQAPQQRQSKPTSTFMKSGGKKGVPKGKAAFAQGFGKYGNYGKKGKGKSKFSHSGKSYGMGHGKGNSFNAMMSGPYHIFSMTEDEASGTQSEGLHPQESVVDTGATATAGGRWAVQQLCQVILKNRPGSTADVYTGASDRPWFRYGDGKWGRALFRVTITYGDTRLTVYSLPSPGVPVLTGMRELRALKALLGCVDGRSLIMGKPTTLRRSRKNHLILDYLNDVFPKNPNIDPVHDMNFHDGMMTARPDAACLRVHAEQDPRSGAQYQQYFSEVHEFWPLRIDVVEELLTVGHESLHVSAMSHFLLEPSRASNLSRFLHVSVEDLHFLLGQQSSPQGSTCQPLQPEEAQYGERWMEEGVEGHCQGDSARGAQGSSGGIPSGEQVSVQELQREEDGVRLHQGDRAGLARPPDQHGGVAVLQPPQAEHSPQQPLRAVDGVYGVWTEAEVCSGGRQSRADSPCRSPHQCDGSPPPSPSRRIRAGGPGRPQVQGDDQDRGV